MLDSERDNARLIEQLKERQQQLNSLIATVPGIVWEAWNEPDAGSQRMDFVSDYVATLLGYTVDEWLSAPNFWLSIVHPADRNRVEQEAATIFANGNDGCLQFRWLTKQGREISVESRVVPIVDAAGAHVGMRGATFDITDRKRAEAALDEARRDAEVARQRLTALFTQNQQETQYFEALVQHSPVAIVTIDLDFNVVAWNPAAERLFGYTPEEAVGRYVDDLIAPEEMRAEAVGYSQQIADVNQVRAVTQRSRKDGSLVDVELLGLPVLVAGERVGFIAIYHDITDLQLAREAAEVANRAKSAFLANMSHEIRTPMNAVIGMTGLLLDTDLTSEQREFVETIRQSGDALLTIINDILDFSKIEAGKLELECQPFDLCACIESTLDLVVIRADEKGLDVASLVDEQVPRTLIGDVTRLRQILINLLSNAIKFTNQGEVVVAVEARAVGLEVREAEVPSIPQSQLEDSHPNVYEVHFAVRDTGIGIPHHLLSRLFQSFSQADASTTRRYGGTGLGLAISKRLSELMGGTMWVESQPGEGSTFHFTIVVEAVADHPQVTGHAFQPELRGKRLLIVDDNATNRQILLRQAEAWGMMAQATEFPAEALELIRRGDPFDVAILDMQMPEMDGLMLTSEIRRFRDACTLPLVVLTSLGQRKAETEVGHEFAAYVTKPIKASQLYNALMNVFTRQSTRVVERAQTHAQIDTELAQRVPLRILVAEDNAVNQELARQLLKKMGYRADVVANGLEVLDVLGRQPYDVVLMDIQMPDMDGLEATRLICQEWPTAERPRIIAMTANAMQEDRDACLEAGMDDYVAKPIRVPELQAALERSGDWLHHRATGAISNNHSEPMIPTAGTGTSNPTPESSPEPIDQVVLKGLQDLQVEGEPDLLTQIITVFMDETPLLMTAIRTGVLEHNADNVRKATHSLKSNCASLGAQEMAALCAALEQQARSGSLDGATVLVGHLEQEWKRVAAAFIAEREVRNGHLDR